jgi:hypothetical protein
MLKHFMNMMLTRGLHGRVRALLLSLFAVALPLQGCIVNNGPARGTVLVQWDTQLGASCNQMGVDSVNVVVSRDGLPYGTFTNGVCQVGSKSIDVGEGTYSLHVEGITAGGSVVAVTPTITLPVIAYTTVYSDILILSPIGTTNPGASSIQATWTVAGQSPASACGFNGVKTVVLSIVDSSQTKVVGTAQAPCASGVATVTNLVAGTYYVQLDGYTPSDPQGQPSWGTSALKGPFVLNSSTDLTFNGPIDINPLGVSSNVGGLSLGWTAFGSPAATGCAKYVISKVNVTVLAADQTQELKSSQANCSDGQLSFSNLPVGTVYVRIDEANPPDTSAYGNVNLAGPFTIIGGQTASVATAIDIGQRSLIAVPVEFADKGSCSGHGVANVQYQISGNGQVIVPFNDADATKPCELNTAIYKNYVIDLANSPPACAIPGNLTGLVICNAAGKSKLTIQAHGLVGNAIAFGALMDVVGLTDGKLTNVKTPIALQPCSAADPLCQ